MKHQQITVGVIASAETDAVENRPSFYSSTGKRLLDLVLATILLPVVTPLVIFLCLCVRADGGPCLFGHRRVGRDGKKFTCWKIRSMVHNADEKLKDYLATNPTASAEWDENQKLDKDPRVTRFGKFIRRTSLDELPQLFNVLLGQMSFVGPRPVTEKELNRYEAHRNSYLSLRPGITGIWQISGRNCLSYQERVSMDVQYSKSIAFLLDVVILAKTLDVIVRPTGK